MLAEHQTLSLMAAMAENYIIGRSNDLPWHLPKDFQRFKDETKGNLIIMGRKTFESLGSKPLPKRTNVIITRQADYKAEGCVVVSSLDEALQYAGQTDDSEPFVIGGGEIYELALPYAHRIYLTIVHTEIEGDTRFPEFNPEEWQITERSPMPEDEHHDYPFTFYTYERIEQPA